MVNRHLSERQDRATPDLLIGAEPQGVRDQFGIYLDRTAEDQRIDRYALPGAALGVGLLLGIVIGSKTTFHSPVRRRSRRSR